MSEILKLVLSLSASASLIAVLLFALKPLYKNRFYKTWQYYIWLVVVARLLIPFAPETNLVGGLMQRAGNTSARTPVAAYEEVAATAEDEAMAAQDESLDAQGGALLVDREQRSDVQSAAPPAVTPAASPSPWSELAASLWLVWFGVAALLLVRKITSYHSFVRFIQAGREEVDDPDVLDLYFETCEDMGIKPLPLYTNKLAISPMLVGILRPVVLLPRTDIEDGDLRLVLRHELTHYKRRDILYKWLVQIVVCLHWFNPLVYFMSREIGKNCELSCDEAVLRGMDPAHKQEYGDTLLATVQTGGTYGDTVASVTLSEDGKLLKERLEAILAHATKPRVIAVCSVGLSLLLLCGAAYAGAYAGMRSVGQGGSLSAETAAVMEDVPYAVEEVQRQAFTETEATERHEKDITVSGSEDSDWDWSRGNWDGLKNMIDWDDAYANGYNMYSDSHYRDGYLFGLRWRSGDNLDNYESSVSIKVGSNSYLLAFTKETAAYANDPAFIEAAQAQITAKIQGKNGGNDWTRSFFAVTQASGPHSEPPENLLVKAYEADEMGYFLTLLDHVKNGDVIMGLLERAYEKDQTDYVLFLVDALPSGYYTDALAERAVAEGRSEMLMWFSSRLSPGKAGDLASKAFDAGQLGILDDILWEIPNTDTDALAEQAYKDRKLSTLSTLADYMSQEKLKELTERAYDDQWMSGFAVMVDYVYDYQFLRTLAQRAFAEYRYDYQPLLMDYLS